MGFAYIESLKSEDIAVTKLDKKLDKIVAGEKSVIENSVQSGLFIKWTILLLWSDCFPPSWTWLRQVMDVH